MAGALFLRQWLRDHRGEHTRWRITFRVEEPPSGKGATQSRPSTTRGPGWPALLSGGPAWIQAVPGLAFGSSVTTCARWNPDRASAMARSRSSAACW